MSKRSALPQSRKHVLVYDEDWEFLEREYGRYSASHIGVSEVLRKMIHKWVLALKERANEAASARVAPVHQPQTGDAVND